MGKDSVPDLETIEVTAEMKAAGTEVMYRYVGENFSHEPEDGAVEVYRVMEAVRRKSLHLDR